MDAKHQKAFLKALEEMVDEKGISKEIVVDAISEAFKVAYNKKLSDEILVVHKPSKIKKVKKVAVIEGAETIEAPQKLADAIIRCDIDLEKGKIETYRQWLVVNDEDLQDDFVEISNLDERVVSNKIKLGEYYEEELSFDDFTKGDVNRFISAYKQKISRAEKESLLESFQGKIGDLITGTVEKSDDHSVIVNLGRISVTLFQKDLIGKETFKPGDSIRVYVCGISKDDVKGSSLIHCSRSCPEFLEKLFENEIHEIYTGVVKIFKVARIAGVRSKVAVYSEDPNVDASGACIGQNGSRIQSIVSQLGNDRNSKEKIDVVEYSPNVGMFLKECLKPGVLLGAKLEDGPEGQIAYVVCENETGSAAIGFKGTNVILARQLIGLKEIKIMDDSVAKEKELEYTPMSEFELQARELQKEKYREESIKNAEITAEKLGNNIEVKPVVNDEDLVYKDLDSEEEENNIVEEKLETSNEQVASDKTETTVVEEEKPVVVEEVETKPVEEVKVEEFHEVKTTTTLDQLEASLEHEKKAEKEYKPRDSFYKDKKFKKPVKKVEKPVEEIKPIIDEKNKMSIYTAEELAEMEKEETDNRVVGGEEEDYSEYDSDEYYNN